MRWKGKKYSYWLGCTHGTLKFAMIHLAPASNLERREIMRIAWVWRKWSTQNRNTKHNMPNHWGPVGKEEGKKQRSKDEIREEHTREISNQIATRKWTIWHQITLQVYKELPPPMLLRKDRHSTVPVISFCTLTTFPTITITTIIYDQWRTGGGN